MRKILTILLLLVSTVAAGTKTLKATYAEPWQNPDRKQTFIVEYRDAVTGKSHLVRVESKDSINAAFDALWPVTVWPAAKWDEENKQLSGHWPKAADVPRTVNQR